MDKPLIVEILDPPDFTRTGKLIPRTEAWKKGLWYGTFNLWIVTKAPVPSILYQLRSPNIGFAPGKLDVILAGHYENGETIEQAVNHEAREELNAQINFNDLTSLGRRLNVGIGTDGTIRNTVCDLFLIEDNQTLKDFQPQEEEVFAICSCPLEELLKVHQDKTYKFEVEGKRFDGQKILITVDQSQFPYNWDNYHYKMALLVSKYFAGAQSLIY